MKHPHFIHVARGLAALAAVLLSGGCYTWQDYRSQQDARAREDQLILQERFDKIDGRLQGLELESQQIRADFERLRQQVAASAQDRTRLAQIDDLSKRLRDLEAARAKDRQEIVDTLSRKMVEVMGGRSNGGGSPVSSGGRKTPTSGGSGKSQYGYEHEVKSGEVLSAIAAAYGVTVKAIMDENGIKDATKLRAGQKLFIPQP